MYEDPHFPQGKVCRVPFPRVHGNSSTPASPVIIQSASRQAAVFGEIVHREVDISINGVGTAVVNDLAVNALSQRYISKEHRFT